MTSSNGSIFRITGLFVREFTGHRWIPRTKPVTRSFDVFFDPPLNQQLSKQITIRQIFRVWPASGNRLSQILVNLILSSYALQLHNVKIWRWGNRRGKLTLIIQTTPPAKLWTETRILCWVETPVHIRTVRTMHGGLLICRRDTPSNRLPSPTGKQCVSSMIVIRFKWLFIDHIHICFHNNTLNRSGCPIWASIH